MLYSSLFAVVWLRLFELSLVRFTAMDCRQLFSCSILYQRGVYPSEAFKTIRRYGTQVVAAETPLLARYLKDITSHLESWLMSGQLQQLTLVIVHKVTKEVLERWAFRIETDAAVVDGMQ